MQQVYYKSFLNCTTTLINLLRLSVSLRFFRFNKRDNMDIPVDVTSISKSSYSFFLGMQYLWHSVKK